MRINGIAVLFFVSVFLSVVHAGSLVSEIFEYGEASREEVEEVIRPLLSKEGKIVILADRRKVLVQDTGEVLEVVRMAMKGMSAPKANVRISLRFSDNGAHSDQGVRVGYQVGNRDIQVGDPRLSRNSVVIEGKHRSHTTTSVSTQFLVVQSGRSASIVVGREVPLVDYFRRLAVGYGIVRQDTAFRWESIGTELAISPRVLGNGLVEVEVTPRITALANGRYQTVDYKTLTTRVTVKPGMEVSIGGFSKASSEFNQNFFQGGSGGSGDQRIGFSLRADVE